MISWQELVGTWNSHFSAFTNSWLLAFGALRQELQWGGMDQNAIFLHNHLQWFIYHVLKDFFYERLENWCSVGETKGITLYSEFPKLIKPVFVSLSTLRWLSLEKTWPHIPVVLLLLPEVAGMGTLKLWHWVLCSQYMPGDHYPFSPQSKKLQQVGKWMDGWMKPKYNATFFHRLGLRQQQGVAFNLRRLSTSQPINGTVVGTVRRKFSDLGMINSIRKSWYLAGTLGSSSLPGSSKDVERHGME